MQSYDESSKEKSSENNFNGVIQTTNSQNCHQDKQLKLSPLSLFNKLRPSKSPARTSSVSFQDPESQNTEIKANCIGEQATFNSRGSSVSTNERLSYIFKKIIQFVFSQNGKY